MLAFGAGALISAVSVELVEEGVQLGGLGCDGGRARRGRADVLPRSTARSSSASPAAGAALALGAFLDGIPEQLVLGIALGSGERLGLGLLVAIFVSNLPEATGSAIRVARRRDAAGRIVLLLWVGGRRGLHAARTVARVGDRRPARRGRAAGATIDGFAAGALLVMLIDSMIPEARGGRGRHAGLVTVLGFAVAAALSSIS